MYIIIYIYIHCIYIYMQVFLRSAMILRPNSWGLFWQLVDSGGALALLFQPTAVFLGTAEAKRKEQPVQQPGQAAQCQAALFKGADRTGGKMYSPQREHMININQWVAILKVSPTLVFFFFRKAPIHVKKHIPTLRARQHELIVNHPAGWARSQNGKEWRPSSEEAAGASKGALEFKSWEKIWR